ncbi:ATPase [Bacillus sp. J14TS2]|uniref:AAA family ATPase n=1 Tax=Bacillus sp. J14TS2 TaxID=2807188 RepID=UPI001B064239|nr:MoxR family ATPase [Bacillus sp. J14TS2]GIN72796.1 ATPase [Bacillus sp. J14TS2]
MVVTDYRELKKALAANQYYCKKLITYLTLGKPIGLRGEPGIGKSELAEQMSKLLNAKFIDIECHSQLEAADIGVSWNSFKQIVDAQTNRLTGDPFSKEYLNLTPLLECLHSEQPVVLRIDEVDKLNETTSNFFLRFLDKKQMVVHDLAEEPKLLQAKSPIYIFLTSNEYQTLDPAIMRRIAWIELKFPEEKMLAEMLSTKTGCSYAMAKRIAYIVHRLRLLPLEKNPSIGEVLEWTNALLLENNGVLTLEAIQVTIGLILKYPQDEKKGWDEISSWTVI